MCPHIRDSLNSFLTPSVALNLGLINFLQSCENYFPDSDHCFPHCVTPFGYESPLFGSIFITPDEGFLLEFETLD